MKPDWSWPGHLAAFLWFSFGFIAGSPAPRAETSIPTPITINDTTLLGQYSVTASQKEAISIVNHAISKNRGLECSSLPEDVIYGKVDDFIRQRTRDTETWQDVLTRLVCNQVVDQAVSERANATVFANLFNTVRSAKAAIFEPGALVGDNDQILDAFGVILNDACRET
ncbi:hypothetical protein F5Y04DRAFT_191300 [Hypomontagnella monticulosa]|nr:hypothetical protein F5Y04DRAFT_191300 [Hypomontagnella monticulosa]